MSIKWNNNDFKSFLEPLDMEEGESYVMGFDADRDDGKDCIIYGKKSGGKIIIDRVEFA